MGNSAKEDLVALAASFGGEMKEMHDWVKEGSGIDGSLHKTIPDPRQLVRQVAQAEINEPSPTEMEHRKLVEDFKRQQAQYAQPPYGYPPPPYGYPPPAGYPPPPAGYPPPPPYAYPPPQYPPQPPQAPPAPPQGPAFGVPKAGSPQESVQLIINILYVISAKLSVIMEQLEEKPQIIKAEPDVSPET